MKILELPEPSDDRHLRAEAICDLLLDSGEEIVLATVYRALTRFDAAGLVTRHCYDGGHAVLEINNGERHEHLVDVESGRVVEFYGDVIERRRQENAKKSDFAITGHSMALRGRFHEKPKSPAHR